MNTFDIINDHKIAKKIKQAEKSNNEISAELLPTQMIEEELPDLIQPAIYNKESGQLIEQQDSLDDLRFSRETLQGLMGNGQTVLNQLMQTAMLSGNPRAYEVVSQMIKTLTDASKEIVNLQSKMLDIQIKSNIASGSTNTTDNNENGLFNGTTSDLLDQLEKARKVED